MATKIGDLYFEVSASTEKISKSIAGIGSAAKDSGSIIDKAVGGAFIAAGIAATTALATIGAGLAAVGLEFNAAGQRATGLFTALTGSAEEAVSLMRQFSEISLDTPIFSGKALQDVSRTLLAYGVAKNDVVDLAVAINSTATALGVGELGAHKLALALGQVKSRGFFSAEEARQLANYGVNAYGLIAEAVGMTTSEVRELGKEHKLLSDDVLPILIDKLQTTYGPVAQNLINTFGVQVQGLKNQFTGFASALAQPFIGRTGGGALVELLSAIRSSLEGVVTVGEDGTFKLGGSLEGLTTITQALADGFLELGYSIIDAFSSFSGGGGFSSFTQNVADAIPKLVQATKEFASGAIDFFGGLLTAVQPLVEPVKNLVLLLADQLVQIIPALADGLVNFADAAAPVAAELITITNLFLKFVGNPLVVETFQVIAIAMGDLSTVMEALGPHISTALVLIAALRLGLLGVTVTAGTATTAVGLLGLQFAAIAPQIALAIAALAEYRAISAGAHGGKAQNDFLTGDVPFFEKPIQDLAKISFEAFGPGPGAVEAMKQWSEYDRLVAMNTKTAQDFANAQAGTNLTIDEFRAVAEAAGFKFDILGMAMADYKAILDDVQKKNVEAGLAVDAFAAANAFEARVAGTATSSLHSLSDATEEEIDVLKELKEAAKAAWEEVDKLLRPTADVTVDDFFRELPKLAEDLTDALKEQEKHPGILGDLAVSGAQEAVRKQAREVIETLAKTYGIGLDGVKALLDKRGLGAVIEALGTITKETTKTVDPLIAKYGQLGATADQLKDAVAKLNDQRQTAIKAQIDQVEAALRDAKDAATAARDAIREFFEGPKGSNTQKLIDTLIGNVGDIGSKIEDGLRLGGVQGAAAIRLALGDVQSQLADVVSSGLDDGLSGQQIVDMLGPIGTVLQEQANQALNRISSLDWTEGFTPAAGAEIASLLSSVLDPGAIQDLLNKALGADKTVSGLEKQLESLKAAAQLDVVFSPEQVQGALDDIAAENKVIETTPLVTPEAAQAVLTAIQDEFDDPTNELKTTIDRAILAQQVMDAAEAGAKQTHLIFDDAMIAFNLSGLSEAGAAAATEFINGFNEQQQLIRDQFAQSQGFDSYTAMQAALGPAVTGAITPQLPYLPTVTVNTPVTINGQQSPIATGAEVIAAQSAAAGSGGQLSRSLQEIYGYRPLAGQTAR